MEENTLWLRIWQTLGIVVAAITLTISGCSAHQTMTVANMVAGGADPIRAACAVSAGIDRVVCATVAATK